MRRRTFWIVVGLLAVLAAVTLVRPLLDQRQRVTATSTPAPLYTVAPVTAQPDQAICVRRTLLNERTQVAEFINDSKGPRPSLELVASGPGYRSAPVRIPGGRGGRHAVRATFEPPDDALVGALCLRNTGTRAARLVGVEEFRTLTRSQTYVDGELLPVDLSLQFYASQTSSDLALVPEMVDRVAVGRGFLGHTWLVWFVLVCAFVGVPVVVLTVLYRTLVVGR